MSVEEVINIAEQEIAKTKASIVQTIGFMYEDLQSSSELLMREIGEAISDNYEAKRMDNYNNSRYEIEMNSYLPSVVKGVRTIEGLQRLVKALKED